MSVGTYKYTGNDKSGIQDQPDTEKLFAPRVVLYLYCLPSSVSAHAAGTSKKVNINLPLLGERSLSIRSCV